MPDDEIKRFDIRFEGRGRASGKMRSDISVAFKTMEEHFELATDEGGIHGGDGTAPPPLALFTAALTGCLMTQIRAFSRRMKIEIGTIEVTTKLHWEGEQIGRAPYVTRPIGFSMDVDLDSPASEEDQRALLDAAKKGCFIEQTLAQGLIVDHRLKLGSEWQDA